jgi:hypothetical protein
LQPYGWIFLDLGFEGDPEELVKRFRAHGLDSRNDELDLTESFDPGLTTEGLVAG